jgi:hypothetical protein
MSEPQSFKNHARYDPLFHFSTVPLALIAIIAAIYLTIHDWPQNYGSHFLWILIAVISLMLAGVARSSALRAQDRVIRLEERLRYAAVLQPADLAASSKLTIRQMIALRFASDAELPALVTRAIAENLTSKQIKESIVNWRADDHRV